MRGMLVLAAVTLAAMCAKADETQEKLCILAASQHLPRIPGLLILESRTAPLPKELKQNKSIEGMSIEIDVRAAGRDATYSLLCAFAPGKPTVAAMVGLIR